MDVGKSMNDEDTVYSTRRLHWGDSFYVLAKLPHSESELFNHHGHKHNNLFMICLIRRPVYGHHHRTTINNDQIN